MKRKTLILFLGGEAVLLLALALLTARFPTLFSSMLAFPFEQIGMGLRALSLLGRWGNAAALALWAGLSLLPMLPVLRHWRDTARKAEHAALFVLTLLLFAALYAMVNPAALYALLPETEPTLLPLLKSTVGAAVWSGVVLWAVFWLLRQLRGGETPMLLKYLRVLLYALCALFTAAIALPCGELLAGFFGQAISWQEGAAAVLRFAVEALPYWLDIAVTFAGLALLTALVSGEKDGAEAAAQRLSRRCCAALGIVSAVTVGWNILQLLLSRWLGSIDVTVELPLLSIAFVLAALLLARLITENRRLRDDNELFI